MKELTPEDRQALYGAAMLEASRGQRTPLPAHKRTKVEEEEGQAAFVFVPCVGSGLHPLSISIDDPGDGILVVHGTCPDACGAAFTLSPQGPWVLQETGR
jgi:hypothetical protein